MKLHAIRHATQVLYYNGKKILVDPVLSEKGTMAAIAGVPNESNNPLTGLPVPVETLIDADAVLVTHTHRDHFDDAAAALLPKAMPIFCQPKDESKLKAKGFENVTAVVHCVEWNGISITRTRGRHGHGITAWKMAPVSGFVLRAQAEPSVYIAGDTVYYAAVAAALCQYRPEVVICYCGAAQFAKGRPITMGNADLLHICKRLPKAQVVAVHMEAWNHCRLTRQALKEFSAVHKLPVFVPEDGELLNF